MGSDDKRDGLDCDSMPVARTGECTDWKRVSGRMEMATR